MRIVGLCLLSLWLACVPRQGGPRLAAPSAAPSPRALARAIFRQLVEIDTSVKMGSGGAARAMAARLAAAGFEPRDLELVGPGPQHLNLVVRLRGAGRQRPVLFIGHLDVVEARRQDWSFDPFTFLEKDGYYYGRGSSDMKCEDADIVANLIRLRREGFVPRRDIIVALTEDEEAGDADGVEWLLGHRRDLVDAELAINLEGGGGGLKSGRPLLMEVQTAEKVYVTYQFEVRNRGGHSSMPVKDNAIYRLAAGLTRLAQLQFPIHLNPTTRAYFARATTSETAGTRADIAALLETPMDPAAAERLAASSPYYNALLRTTCVPTMLGGGRAENALPQTARAVVNCRVLPDEEVATVLAALRRTLADSQVAITLLEDLGSGGISPPRREIMDVVERLTASMWPGVPVSPSMMSGTTDGRFLRRAGIPTYGVSGMFFDVDDVRDHGKDERIGVKEFHQGVEFMYRFLRSL